MPRTLVVVAFCLCVAVAFAADLRRLSAQKTAGVVPGTPGAAKTISDAKDGKDGDQQTASSFYGYGFYGPGYGFGGPWGGYGGGWGGYGGYGWGGYGGYGGYGYPGGYYGGFW